LLFLLYPLYTNEMRVPLPSRAFRKSQIKKCQPVVALGLPDSTETLQYGFTYKQGAGGTSWLNLKLPKRFRIGASQAVSLSAQFRFEGTEVFISRDESTGDVVLSACSGVKAWAEFFELQQAMDHSESLSNFMPDRPINCLPVDKDLFKYEAEQSRR
jgi:antitoxin VapB